MSTNGLQRDAAIPAGATAVAALAWRRAGALYVTVIAKATFAFANGAEMARVSPQPIVGADVHHDQHPARSVQLTTDRVPYLARADVVFTGHAYAPGGPAERFTARLGVVEGTRPVLDKTLVVQPDRSRKVPMRYELAFGGPGWQDNPYGTGAVTGSSAPSIVLPRDPRVPDGASPGRRLAGFAPIGAAWTARRKLLGDVPQRALAAPIVEIPDGFAWEYFQCAPADQRVAFLRGDEWIVLGNLSPSHPRLATRLPGARGLARIHGLGPWGMAEGRSLELHADVLRIDGDAERCTLTYRGAFPVAAEAALEALHVVAGVVLPDDELVWPSPASGVAPHEPPGEVAAEKPVDGTMSLGDDEIEPVLEPLPGEEESLISTIPLPLAPMAPHR